MFIPAMLILGSGYMGWRYLKKRNMTAKEKQIFDEAFRNMKEPEKLLALAEMFKKEGFAKEAEMLTKRAALRDQPPEVYKARRGAFDKALSVKDPSKIPDILALAAEFDKIAAVGAADTLRKYAATLKAA